MVSEPKGGGAIPFLKVARRSVSMGSLANEKPAQGSATVSPTVSGDEPSQPRQAETPDTRSADAQSDRPEEAQPPEFDRFLSGKPDDFLIDAVAYGLFARDRKQKIADKTEPTPEESDDPDTLLLDVPVDVDEAVVDHWRAEARAKLSSFAYRHLHNQVDQIRRKALLDGMKHLRRGAGFFDVFIPTFLAITIVVGSVLYVSTHQEDIRGFATELRDLYRQWGF